MSDVNPTPHGKPAAVEQQPSSGVPRDGRQAGRTPPAPKVLPATLVELYRAPKARPADLLRYLDQRDMFITSDEDQEAALSLLGEADRDLIKTRALAYEVANAYEGRFVGAFSGFLLRAMAPDLEDVLGWPFSDPDGAARFWSNFLDRKRAGLTGKTVSRRTLNVLFVPRPPERTATADPRDPYGVAVLAVDPTADPLRERLDVNLTIDSDLVVHVDLKSSLALDSRSVELHGLEFGLRVAPSG